MSGGGILSSPRHFEQQKPLMCVCYLCMCACVLCVGACVFMCVYCVRVFACVRVCMTMCGVHGNSWQKFPHSKTHPFSICGPEGEVFLLCLEKIAVFSLGL